MFVFGTLIDMSTIIRGLFLVQHSKQHILTDLSSITESFSDNVQITTETMKCLMLHLSLQGFFGTK